jgi:prepilin-type processing-associated H-X9-DG protein
VGTDGGWTWADGYSIYLKMTQLTGPKSPGPSKTWVFLDEREDIVNWGNYMTDMHGYYNPANAALYEFSQDLPGMYHNLAAGFSFVDGHSEIKRWLDPRTCPKLYSNIPDPYFVPRDQDVAWLQDRTTRPK